MNQANSLLQSFIVSKILRFYLKASLSGLPTSSLTPELFDLSSTKRPKTGVQIAQVCILHIMLFGSFFLASYLPIGQNCCSDCTGVWPTVAAFCHDGHLNSSSLSYSGCDEHVLVPTCRWMEIHLGVFGSAQVWGENSQKVAVTKLYHQQLFIFTFIFIFICPGKRWETGSHNTFVITIFLTQ